MIYRGESAIEYLAKQLSAEDTEASSHWQKYHSEFEYTGAGFKGLQGFGGNSKPYSSFRKFLHHFFQDNYRKMGSVFPDFDEIDRLATEITSKQHRAYDLDVLRQSLTLALLKNKQKVLPNNRFMSCVIGDGFASMTSLMMASGFSTSIVLINLTKTLLVDLWFLKLWLSDSDFESLVYLVTDDADVAELERNVTDFNMASGMVIAIQAKNHQLIRKLPIDLVVNIASMQEMDLPVIHSYFEDFRAISAQRELYFYCCNRERKKLPDGTVTKLSEYPWENLDQILIDEPCPWHLKYYSYVPPFIHSYDGLHRHMLVKMS